MMKKIMFKFWYIVCNVNRIIMDFYIDKELKANDQNEHEFYFWMTQKYCDRCIKYLSKMRKYL